MAEHRDARQRLEELRATLDTNQQRALERFEARCGKFGERERRNIADVELRGTTDARDYAFAVKGHAIVYGRKSLDLGGFTEIIADRAASSVLDRHPHVVLVRDHQLGTELLSTRSPDALLELREDPKGVHFYGKVPDLGDLTDRTYKQMKAGLVNRDKWEIRNEGTADEQIVRTIEEIDDLFDVTITSQGAYPQTDSAVIRAYAFAYAETTGSFPETTGGAEPQDAATDQPSGSEGDPAGVHERTGGPLRRNQALADLTLSARQEAERHRHELEKYRNATSG
jgi:HK97 family phage prohead protease